MQKKLLIGLLASTLVSSTLCAQWGQLEDSKNISLGAQFGGLAGVGIGAQLKYKIDSKFGVRAGFDTISVSDVEIEDEDVTYNFDATVQDLNLLIDWHPWAGSFRTTAGLLINNSDLDGDLTPTASNDKEIEFEFEGTTYKYAADELGSIHTTADFDPVAPYVGIGWDTSFGKDKGFGFTFDIGVAFTGSMKADYTLKYGEALNIDAATANLEGEAKEAATKEILAKQKEIEDELGKELDKEMIALQDELDEYEILPYISIGFNYKF